MSANLELTYNDADHTYFYGGRLVPSVTRILTILDNFYINENLQEAMDRGTEVHTLTEQHDRNEANDLSTPHYGYLAAWKMFVLDSGFVQREIERMIYHPILQYAGRLDRVGEVSGDLTVLDIKTGNKAATHKLQLAAYSTAYEAETKQKVKRSACVYLRNDGNYSVDWKPDPNAFNDFVAALRVYRWRERHGKK